jgi:dTMP kinase
VLISVEGIDGSGKTSLIDGIVDEYPFIVQTKEPTSGLYGQLIRGRSKSSTSSEMLDFFTLLCDRVQHLNKTIRPSIERGSCVLTDRYADSTRAYQPIALSSENGPFESMWEAKLFVKSVMQTWVRPPELTVYIDVSVDTAIERVSNEHRYENREFLEQVKDNYEELYDTRSNVVVIDGEQSVEDMTDSAISKLDVLKTFS